MFKLIELFHPRDALIDQFSDKCFVKAGIPHQSVLGPLLFLIYMKGLPQRLKSDIKLFADHTFLFSITNCKNTLKSTFISDLLARAQQIAHTVTSVHAKCTQRGFCMHKIMCTQINQNTFK